MRGRGSEEGEHGVAHQLSHRSLIAHDRRSRRWKALFIRSVQSSGSRFSAARQLTTSQNSAVMTRRSPRISCLPGAGIGLSGPIRLGPFGVVGIAISLTRLESFYHFAD